MKAVMIFTFLILLILVVPLSPLFTLWSFSALGWSVPVTAKTYFATTWLLILAGTMFAKASKKND